MSKDHSLFQQIEDYASDQELLKPILKEAREDRDRIRALESTLRKIQKAIIYKDQYMGQYRDVLAVIDTILSQSKEG